MFKRELYAFPWLCVVYLLSIMHGKNSLKSKLFFVQAMKKNGKMGV
jgi:hypothetical protein